MTDLATEDIERLWTTYKSDGSQKARDQLIVHYSPLVKYVSTARPARTRWRPSST